MELINCTKNILTRIANFKGLIEDLESKIDKIEVTYATGEVKPFTPYGWTLFGKSIMKVKGVLKIELLIKVMS